MSFISAGNSRVSYIDVVNPNVYNNYQNYETFLDLPTPAPTDVRFFYIKDENKYYRWDNLTLSYIVAVPDATDAVLSASNVGTGTGQVYKQEVSNNLEFKTLKASNNITVTNNTSDITLDTIQPITTTANPTFNTITLNGTVTNNTDATTKLYVDTAVATTVQSVTAGSNMNITGTAINPIVNLNSNLISLSSISTVTGTCSTQPTSGIDIANKTYVDNSSALNLKIANNFSDLSNFTTARTNLDVYSKSEVNSAIGAIDLTPYMQKANNLSDLTNTTTARTNLGVYSTTQVDTALANINMDDLLNTNLATIQASNVIGFDGVNYVPAETTSQLDITNSLLFNADFNSNINDSSTYTATGTAVGTIATVTRAGGNAREAQVTNSYITYGYLSHLNFTTTQQFTISFWVRHSITGTTARTIISQADAGAGWLLTLDSPNNNRIHFVMEDTSSARNVQARWENIPNFGDGNWHHIVFTKGDGITIDKFKLYYDGVLRDDLKSLANATLLITDNVQVANTVPTNLFSFNNGAGTEFFIGALDDVRIYNFELKEQQAKTLYTNAENNHVVLNVIAHTHAQSDIIGLNSRLTVDESNISLNTTNISTVSGQLSTHTGNTAIHFTEASINHNNILNKGTNTHAQIDTHIADTTIHFNIDSATRNLLSRINLHVFTFPASFTLPVTYSLSANESLTLNMSVANDVITNYLLAFKSTGHPQRALHYTTSALKQTIFGVRLTGANWTGASIDRCRLGWCSAQFYENVEGNFPSAVYLIQPASNNASTSANRAYTTGFLTTGGYFNQNGVSTLVSRTGFTSDAIGAQNDILLTTWDAAGGFYLTMWYRGTGERSRMFGVMPNGTGLNNFMSSDLSPIVSIGNSGTGWNIEILSERDLTALGITFPNNTNYFY